MSHVPPRVFVSSLTVNNIEYSVLWKELAPVVCEAAVYRVVDKSATTGKPLYRSIVDDSEGAVTSNTTDAVVRLRIRVEADGATNFASSETGDIDELFDLIKSVQTAALEHLGVKTKRPFRVVTDRPNGKPLMCGGGTALPPEPLTLG